MAEEQNPLEGLPQGEFIRPATTDVKNYLPFNNPITPDDELYSPTPVRQPRLAGQGLPGRSSNIQQYAVKDKVTAYPPFAPNQMPQSFKRGDRYSDHLNTMIQKRAQSSIDSNVYAKPFMYDATASGANKARYKAYGQKTYDRVGFNPEINNEEVFNANTSMLDDYIRMGTHAFLPMLTNGLFANPKSYGKLLSGDIGQDLSEAEDYENYNNLGYSTKGGVFGFINNMFNSVAYSAGIMIESTAEMALLGAVEGSIVGPEGTVVGGALGGATGAVKGLFSLPKALWNMGKFGGAMVKNLGNLERFSAAQRLFNTAARTTVNFINPIENTTSALKAAYGEANNLTNLARASKSAAGFFRDVSFINAAFSEGRLEGGMVENNAYRLGYDRFWKENNRAPNEQEQLDLRKTAKLAGFQDTWKNGLLVMYTNKIAFPNLYKGNMLTRLTNNVARIGDEFDIIYKAAKRQAVKAGEDVTKKVVTEGTYELADFNLRNALKGLIRPGNLGKASLNYFKTNLMEGTQEVMQDVIANATEKYYLDAYFDPAKQNFDYSIGALGDAFGAQAGERGFETFASGFFMGMMLKPFGGAVPRYASMMYTKATKSAEEYETYIKERSEYGERVVKALNRMDQNPADFLNDRKVNYGVAAKLSKIHNDDDTTTKEHKDAVQVGFSSDVLTALSSGTFDIWKKNFSRFKQLNEKELEQAFELEPGEGGKAKKMLDDYLKKADKLQERYNYAMKTFGSKMVDLSKLKKGTPEHDKATIYNLALDRSIKNMIFMQDSFDNNLERLAKMYKTWSPLDPNAKLPGFDFQTLTDPSLLNNTIDMLSAELEALKQSMESTQPNLVLSSKVDDKEELLNTLKEFSKSQLDFFKARFQNDAFNEARKKYMEEQNLSEGDAELKAFDEIAGNYKKSGVNPVDNFKSSFSNLLKKLAGSDVNYQKMLNSLGKSKSFDDVFNDLVDIHELSYENSVMTPYINLLLDTDGFFEHVNRNFEWMSNLYSNKKEYYKDAVNKSIELKEYNDLLKSLSDKNIYVDLEQFADWMEDKNNLPDYFIDATSGAERIVPKGSMLYGKYVEEFERVTKIQEEKPAGNPADLKGQMEQEIEALEEKKQKELDDAELNFKRDIEEERGAPLEKLRETEAKSTKETTVESEQDPTQAVLDKFQEAIQLVESEDINDVFNAYNIIWKNSLIDIDQFNGDVKKYEKFFNQRARKILDDKKRMAEEIMPLAESYDWSDENEKIMAAVNNAVVMDIVNEEIEKAKQETVKTVQSEPVVLVENSESWKDYQAVIKAIEENYDKLIKQVTKKYAEQGLQPEGVEKITINTEWDSIPDEKFKSRLTKLFDTYLKGRGQENLLAEDPDEYARLRANWFREQGDLIDEYNANTAAKAIKKEREATMLIEPTLKYFESDGDMVSKPLNYLNKILDGLLAVDELGMKLNKKKEVVPLTKKEKENLKNDIAAIEELIEKKRNIVTPISNFEKSYNIFTQNILDRQKEVEQILDAEGNVESRVLDGKTPERVTNIAEAIDIELTPGKKPYLYSPLEDKTKDVFDDEGNVIDQKFIPSPVLEIFNLINDDDSIKPEAKADKFVEKFLQLKYPAFEETTKNKITGKKVENPKNEALRKALKEDFSRENVIKTIQNLSSKESSDVGNTMDVLIKEFLTREGTGWKKLTKPDNMTQEVFDNLFGTRGIITRFRDGIIDGKYMIVGASTLVFDKTLGERGIAGETDLIAIDDQGNFNIIDVKALTNDKWKAFDGDIRLKERIDELTKEGKSQDEIDNDAKVIEAKKDAFKSKKKYFSLQQSIYRNLFFNMTGIMPKEIGLLPIEVEYDKLGNIVSAKLSNLVPEDFSTIELKYMPEVEARVPLKAAPIAKAPTTTQPTEAKVYTKPAEINNVKEIKTGLDYGSAVFTVGDSEFMITPKKDLDNNVAFTLLKYDYNSNLYKQVTNPQTKRNLRRSEIDAFINENLPKEFVDFLINLYTAPKPKITDFQIIDNYIWQSPYRKIDYKDTANLPILLTIDEVNKIYNETYSEELKSGVEKYLKPFAKDELVKEISRQKEQLQIGADKYGNPDTIKKSELYINDLETALKRFTQPTAQPAGAKEGDVYQVTKPKSNKLSNNIGQTVVYQGEIGKLILNSDGTYGVQLPNNIIKTLTFNIKGITDGKTTFDQAGVLPVQLITNYGQITKIDGTEMNAEFLNDEETKAVVNGVMYTVNRNELGNIESLTYESNAKDIADIQEKISDLDEELAKLKEESVTLTSEDKYNQLQTRVQELTNAIANTENEDVKQRLTKKRIVISSQFAQMKNAQNANVRKIAQLEIETKSLETKLKNLEASNYIRTLTGGNADNIIFALNALPNSFQKKTANLKPKDQETILKEISRLSVAPSTSKSIDEIFEDMPYSVDRLWAGGINAINEADLAEIKTWTNSAIQKLNDLASVLLNKGDLIDDVTNQVNAINNFVSQLSLIKLNKDGKISKKQPKEAREAFSPETSTTTSKDEVTASGQAEGATGQDTGVKPTQEQMKAALRGINASADELLEGITTEEGEAESIDKTAEFVSAMNEAKSDKELDKIYYEALKEIDENPAVGTSSVIIDAYKKARTKLAIELSAENAKNDGYVIVKDDNFEYSRKGTIWNFGGVNKDGSVVLKSISGTELLTVTEEELQKYFGRINEESMAQADVEVTQEDQELANATTKTVEEALADSTVLKNAEKEVNEAQQKGSFRDKLKNRKCNI